MGLGADKRLYHEAVDVLTSRYASSKLLFKKIMPFRALLYFGQYSYEQWTRSQLLRHVYCRRVIDGNRSFLMAVTGPDGLEA